MQHFWEVNALPAAQNNPNWSSDCADAAFQMVIGRIADTLRQIDAEGAGHHVATFICDESPKSEKIQKSYYKFKKKLPHLADYMRGISHLDDKRTPPLQMADLMADVAREMVAQWLDDPSTQATCPIPGSVLEIKCWDRDGMLRALSGDSPIVTEAT